MRRATRDSLIEGQWYRIRFSHNIVAIPHLIETSLVSISLIFVLMVLALFLGNKWLFNHINRPFFSTLETIKNYDITQKEYPVFEKTNIEEFRFLQEKLSFLIQASHREYIKLKEFSENLSHELQTPLAIIKTKIDRLQQSTHLKEEEFNNLEEIQRVLQKAAQLNRTLLLFSKIENQEYNKLESIRVDEIVDTILAAFAEMIDLKRIELKLTAAEISINANPYLIELLLTNLISNAIRHNWEGGKLLITMSEQKMIIQNTGAAPEMDPASYFSRFKKAAKNGETSGLGLSIVKQICEVSNYDIHYSFEADLHTMRIRFA
ncbi:MAG: HAMP domain-containing sensor histidine kinase [Bacteroidota bacterium]